MRQDNAAMSRPVLAIVAAAVVSGAIGFALAGVRDMKAARQPVAVDLPAKPEAMTAGALTYAAEAMVRVELREPDSAVFSGVTVYGETVCGFVNARNGFGGMTGPLPFWVDHRAHVGRVRGGDPDFDAKRAEACR